MRSGAADIGNGASFGFLPVLKAGVIPKYVGTMDSGCLGWLHLSAYSHGSWYRSDRGVAQRECLKMLGASMLVLSFRASCWRTPTSGVPHFLLIVRKTDLTLLSVMWSYPQQTNLLKLFAVFFIDNKWRQRSMKFCPLERVQSWFKTLVATFHLSYLKLKKRLLAHPWHHTSTLGQTIPLQSSLLRPMYRQEDREQKHQGALKSRYPSFATPLPSMLSGAIRPTAVGAIPVVSVTGLYTLIMFSWSVLDQQLCKNPLVGRDQGKT